MKLSRATQRNRILQYCQEHGSITNREASENLFINSPTARISEMRNSGLYDISSITEHRVNSYGEKVRFLRYFIREKGGQ